MRTASLFFALPLFLLQSFASQPAAVAAPIIVDHDCVDLPQVPDLWIEAAKERLHIAYGHTSHGSQIPDGMTGLVDFTGGCGGPQFDWNNGGSGGALDLHDRAMAGDCGYYPQWVDETYAYLEDPANADCNVIIWSWCGQVSNYTESDMITRYLDPMTQLELDYPDVQFVYMTGHLNYWARENTNARNQQIRDYCRDNGKILYDFAHIESYDPDGIFFPYANDDCNYWDEFGNMQGNWAEEWQATHVEGVDWYNVTCAHSRPLNGNQKAYAAWWLWARLGGWPGVETLQCDTATLPASTGGTVELLLDAGDLYAGREYVVFATTSGTDPGSLLPGDEVTIPINQDWLTDYVIDHLGAPLFAEFRGTLDADGRAIATLAVDPLGQSWVGRTVNFAFAIDRPWDFASNAVAVEVVP
jgi:hypothetical protein